MRVIAGTARSIALRAPEGQGTRPTTDRIKETLFNMLSPELPGCRFLDLYSGSGGIGIEALSRGASEAVLVEKDRRAVRVIRENLERTHLSAKAEIIPGDVLAACRRLAAAGRRFDLVFLDPPYGEEAEETLFASADFCRLLAADALIVTEASKDRDFSWAEAYGFTACRYKVYKTNQHVFFHYES